MRNFPRWESIVYRLSFLLGSSAFCQRFLSPTSKVLLRITGQGYQAGIDGSHRRTSCCPQCNQTCNHPGRVGETGRYIRSRRIIELSAGDTRRNSGFQLEVLAGAIPWRFKSSRPHHRPQSIQCGRDTSPSQSIGRVGDVADLMRLRRRTDSPDLSQPGPVRKRCAVREEMRARSANASLLSARHGSGDRTRGDETLRRLCSSPLFSSPVTKSLCQARLARRIPGALWVRHHPG